MSENRQFDYDVAFSFAGEDRQVVERIALEVRNRGISVFYDDFEKSALWGKDLYEYLADLYSKRAKFCVIFASASYKEKRWTNHERRSAQERALEENREYILPIRIDDTQIPGLSSTIAYLDLRTVKEQEVIQAIIDKLRESGQADGLKQWDKAESHATEAKPENHVKAIVRVSGIPQNEPTLSELQKAANRARFGIKFPNDYGSVIGCPFSLETAQYKTRGGLQYRHQIPSQMKPYSGMKCEEELFVRTDAFVQLTYEYSFDDTIDSNFALELYFKQLFYTLHFAERLLKNLNNKAEDIKIDIEVHVPFRAYLFDHLGFVDTKMEVAYFTESVPIKKEEHVTLEELQSKTGLILRLSNAVLDGFEYSRGPKGLGIPEVEIETIKNVVGVLKSRVHG